MPKISVIMSVYKEPVEWLCQSIDSILLQTFTDFEFIIVNDNPERDANRALLQEYCDKDRRIKVICNDENIGLTKSLNKGLAMAKGKYIARMDADDISMPRRFEKQYDYMEKHLNVAVLGTAFKFIGKGTLLKQTGLKYDNESIRAQMLLVNCIAHSSVFIRKEILDSHNLKYDEFYRQSQDYRLWELISPFGDFACLHDVLLKYRVSPQQITRSQGGGQSNLASSVRLRFQKAWLKKIGLDFSDDMISERPFEIIKKLRGNSFVNGSKEYRAYLQYAYLYSGDKSWTLNEFGKYDLLNLNLFNCCRLIAYKTKDLAGKWLH